MDALHTITNLIALSMILVQVIFGFMLIIKNDVLEGVRDSHMLTIGAIIIGLADLIIIISLILI
jgi:hypothetical protein